jgi:hypothetical protein
MLSSAPKQAIDIVAVHMQGSRRATRRYCKKRSVSALEDSDNDG